MSRVETRDPKTIKNPETRSLLEGIEKSLGKVPNIFRNMSNSPAVLKAYTALSDASSQTTFPDDFREELALAIAQTNQCQYCLSAHTAIAKGQKISENDILLARQGTSKDPKRNLLLHFAKEIVQKRGHVDNSSVDALKKGGITDQEITEIVLIVVLNIFTNYFNLVTDTEVDFPKVELAGVK